MNMTLILFFISVWLLGGIGEGLGSSAPSPISVREAETPITCRQPSACVRSGRTAFGAHRQSSGGIRHTKENTSPSKGSLPPSMTALAEQASMANNAQVGGMPAGPKKTLLSTKNPYATLEYSVRGIGITFLFHASRDPFNHYSFRYKLYQSCWGTQKPTNTLCKYIYIYIFISFYIYIFILFRSIYRGG